MAETTLLQYRTDAQRTGISRADKGTHQDEEEWWTCLTNARLEIKEMHQQGTTFLRITAGLRGKAFVFGLKWKKPIRRQLIWGVSVTAQAYKHYQDKSSFFFRFYISYHCKIWRLNLIGQLETFPICKAIQFMYMDNLFVRIEESSWGPQSVSEKNTAFFSLSWLAKTVNSHQSSYCRFFPKICMFIIWDFYLKGAH